jgi:hypothetical protein
MRTKKEQVEVTENLIELQALEEKVVLQGFGIYCKLWKAKHEIKGVTKGKDNPFFKSKYADLNAILDAVEPILLKYNLIVLQPILDGCVVTQIIDIETGEKVESKLLLPIINDPQKQIAGVTYFRRATLQSLLSLQAVDDDGNEISTTVKNTKPTISQERFENGLTKIQNGEMTREQFKQALSGYQLTDLQTKSLSLL